MVVMVLIEFGGGDGSDNLAGGAGKDILNGAAGRDAFVFLRVSDSGVDLRGADIVQDFVLGGDKIDLRAIDAFAPTVSNDAFIWNVGTAFTSTTRGEVRFKQFNNSGTSNDYTLIYVDNDRDVAAEMVIRLNGLHNLTASDFVL